MGKSKRRSPHSKRRRNRNKKEDNEKEDDGSMDEIQAQLERQRRKRALENTDTDTTDEPPVQSQQSIGGYEYDPVMNAYFPKGSNIKVLAQKMAPPRTISTVKSCHFLTNAVRTRVQDIPTAWIGHVSQICTSPQRFHDLRAHWAGRIVVSTLQIEASAKREFDPASRQPSGWTSLFPQLRRLRDPSRQTVASHKDTPWDMNCKNKLHASSRTFDVLMGSDESHLPNIATLVDGGAFVRRARDPRVWNERQYMGSDWERSTHFEAERGNHMIRFMPPRESFTNVARLNNYRPGAMEILHLGPAQSHSVLSEISVCDTNDVAFHPLLGSGNAAEIAVAPRIARNTRLVTLYRDIRCGTSFEMMTKDFSKSDALCVEYLNENTALYGHRNGSISLLDTRRKTVQLVSPADEEGGSATSLLPLTDRNMFLAKKSFASCRLFDIRMLSPQRKNSAMVWNLNLPKADANTTLSTCCSGIAVDPTQTIAIAPFADGQRRSHFALWSLTNGQLIGTKLAKATTGETGIGLPHCELRAAVTPAWQLETDQDGTSTVKRKSNAWGLWFKSGQVEPLSPSCIGAIHQLTFRGQPDKSDIGCQIENL